LTRAEYISEIKSLCVKLQMKELSLKYVHVKDLKRYLGYLENRARIQGIK